MKDAINIRKGLDIPIDGEAERCVTDVRGIRLYAVKPTDFVGLTPKLMVQEGDQMKAGQPLFCDKNDERIHFTSPVDGKVKAIVRGEKRKLMAVVVEAESRPRPIAVDVSDLKAALLECGLWPLLRQRPFGTIANPDDQPKAIFVSAFNSAPLAPDYDFVLQGREDMFFKGLEALTHLTDGKVHVCFRPNQHIAKQLRTEQLNNCQLITHYINGPHPAGNIGTQIAHIDPINKGEVVWTMNPQDVATLGELVATGCYRPEKLVALVGPHISNPHYYKVVAGACVASMIDGQVPHPDYPAMGASSGVTDSRIISGSVLSGTQIAHEGFLGAYDDMISILPEGDYYNFMGWLMPGFKKFSFSRTFLSGFMPKSTFKPLGIKLPRLEKFWKFDTNTHGDERPLVFTGNFERVFPFDIYPTQLIKACIVGDIELMESLGIYEVEPEDFALCEFIDTSKTEIQVVIREALERLRKEALG